MEAGALNRPKNWVETLEVTRWSIDFGSWLAKTSPSPYLRAWAASRMSAALQPVDRIEGTKSLASSMTRSPVSGLRGEAGFFRIQVNRVIASWLMNRHWDVRPPKPDRLMTETRVRGPLGRQAEEHAGVEALAFAPQQGVDLDPGPQPVGHDRGHPGGAPDPRSGFLRQRVQERDEIPQAAAAVGREIPQRRRQHARLLQDAARAAPGQDVLQALADHVDPLAQGIGVVGDVGQVGQGVEEQRVAALAARRPDHDLGLVPIADRLDSLLGGPSGRVDGPLVAQSGQIVGAVDDDRGQTQDGGLLDQALDQHRLSGPDAAEDHRVLDQPGGGNGNRLADPAVGRIAQEQPILRLVRSRGIRGRDRARSVRRPGVGQVLDPDFRLGLGGVAGAVPEHRHGGRQHGQPRSRPDGFQPIGEFGPPLLAQLVQGPKRSQLVILRADQDAAGAAEAFDEQYPSWSPGEAGRVGRR